ncbi:MAG: DUF1344 domain-containing protein [Rhizobiaceae bacterium]
MRTLVPVAIATLLATSAFAATLQQSSGTVRLYDHKAMTLQLADGESFMLPANFKDPGIKVGGHVAVSWEKSGLDNMARSVTLIK